MFALYVFLIYGFAWLLLVSALAQKHANQGARRLIRDMHEEMMSDTISGPHLGQPRAWERHERAEKKAMIWSTRILVASAIALYFLLSFD